MNREGFRGGIFFVVFFSGVPGRMYVKTPKLCSALLWMRSLLELVHKVLLILMSCISRKSTPGVS